MTLPIPEAALRDHIASLGKTGSGKTSDTKVIVEHITAPGWSGLEQGARVCVLDLVKSDWWGLTSSADGKKPGRPFQILGGPHGHVPLNSNSGKVIGELVAKGALRLSILDMADFEPGGPQRFFAEFAAALFRHIKGIVYLVVEEAHELAPKERAGFGHENMAIHWMKKLGTGGRSKGIRMLVCSQRTQALHNAVLGSCETMIAGRFTAPADQDPVLDWFKRNVPKEKFAEIAASMSSLKNGEAWVACGEAAFLQRVQFPRIKTFDNSATPEHGAADVQVRTAPVDRDRLAQLIGIAAEEVAANDPKALKAALAAAHAALAKKPAAAAAPASDAQVAAARSQGFQEGAAAERASIAAFLEEAFPAAVSAAAQAVTKAHTGFLKNIADAKALKAPTAPPPIAAKAPPAARGNGHAPATLAPLVGGTTLPQARVMASLAFWKGIGHPTPTREQVAAVAGYKPGSGNFNNLVGGLSTMGHTRTPAPGRLELLTDYPLMDREAAQAKLWSVFDGPQQKLVRAALAADGEMGRDDLATAAGYSPGSGNFNNITGSLTTMDVLTRPGVGRVALSDWAREVLA